jgi:4-aminobutyrate aminotransferase
MDLLARDDRVVAGAEKLRFFPLAVTGGSGSYLLEEGGRHLLDLSASCTAAGLGYGHPALVSAVQLAIASPPGTGAISSVNPHTVGLAEDLLSRTSTGEDPSARRVYLGNCGTDANDVALRCARLATGRRGLLAFASGYHGGLGLAMAVSGVHVEAGTTPDADTTFLPFPRTPEDLVHLERQIGDALSTGAFAACIVEPIQSDGGLLIPPDGFLDLLCRSCRAAGTLLIVDEVKVGLGRTGDRNAYEHDGIEPDIVTFGKALGGGLPLSAAVGPAWVLDGPTASALLTTAGNPVCAAAGRSVLRTIDAEGLVEAARVHGDALMVGFDAGRTERMGQVRGRGLTIGVEIIDPTTGEADPAYARRVVFRAWQLGVVMFYVGGSVLEITPPLTINAAECGIAIDAVTRAIAEADAVSDGDIAPFAGW